MFQCERCGSSYSSAHTVGVENCPRCLLRDKTVAPLSLKIFDLSAQESSIRSRTDVPSVPERIRTASQS